MLKIGNANGVNVFLNEAEGMNRHIIIFGKSGSGKSVAQQILCKRILEGGGTVLALDLHNTLGEKNIFPPFRETLGLTLHEIDAYAEGIPVDLFKPAVYEDGDVERDEDAAAAVCDVISKTVSFGSRQKTALQRAAEYVQEEKIYEKKGLTALEDGLRLQKTEVAETVNSKLAFLLKRKTFVCGTDKELIQEEKFNVVRLSKFPDDLQALLAELLLAYIWRRVLSGEISDLYIVIDEFQNLSIKKQAALEKLLVEGRKYGIGLILATQALGINFSNSQQRLLLQSGVQLYFKPAENEIRDVAKILGGTEIAAYTMLLARLDIGECVALGPIQLGEAGTLVSSSPTKIKITI